MERTISLTELRGAVDEAYELFKNEHSGSVDPRIRNAKENAFGISMVLTDGTVINKGDADVPSPIGAISKIPASVALLSQMSPADLIKKSGTCCCRCSGGKTRKPDIPLSSHGIRAVSAIEPTGDADGKWEVIINNMINLIGSAPELDDDLYKALTEEAAKANVENVIAEAGYTLYDDAPIAIDLYIRQMAMTATSEQLATMCAT
ncbi:MAG: glutaminase, partial [Muribaculaceae bacterium]|nr:glutaminase [Muribaculaceae bacterium]